jgi:hypothetical protein
MGGDCVKRLIAILLLLAALTSVSGALCENYLIFILCNPKTPVNVRTSPKKGHNEAGRLDFGDWAETDGEIRNGYIRIYGIGEAGVGWVHAGYVVKDEPRKVEKAYGVISASGRVKSYRRIGGKGYKWLNIGDEVKVFALSEEWAVTNKGYIRTKYLEVWYE